jgi:phosphoribosylamine--glycine ligase
VVEERLEGSELSLLALCDGERALPMAPARDYKRIGEGDTGPNTGGMGSYSPVAGFDAARVRAIAAAVHQPVVDLMRARGAPFHGVLYAGLMLTASGPSVLEFNVRFGDPEAQVVLPRIDGDVAALLAEVAAGNLRSTPSFRPEVAVTVVCASEGYPTAPRTGDVIDGLDAARAVPGVTVYCAGVAADGDGRLVTAGGRVLAVTGMAATVGDARRRAYEAVGRISWPGMHHRSDIGGNTGHDTDQDIGPMGGSAS